MKACKYFQSSVISNKNNEKKNFFSSNVKKKKMYTSVLKEYEPRKQ